MADVIAEQVNMTVVAPERTMDRMRDIFAKASISAARKWTFSPPTTGEDSTRDSWTVRVPVTFALNNSDNGQPERYGRWRAFIPARARPHPGARRMAPDRREVICCRPAACTWSMAPSAACAC